MPWGNQKGSHTYSFDLKIACYGSSPCTSTFRICCTFCTIYHHISPLKKMARTKSYANPCAEICRFRGFRVFAFSRENAAHHRGGDTHISCTAFSRTPRSLRRVVAANQCETNHEANCVSYARRGATSSVPSIPARRLEPRMKHVLKPGE
jgi:hypothetical protein